MALPVLRGWQRVHATFGLSRLLRHELGLVRRSGTGRVLPSPAAAATAAGTSRWYSSERDGNKASQKVVVVGIPNPFIWVRTRIYYFLIRAYFDKDFNIEEFTEGAKQVCKKKTSDQGCTLNLVPIDKTSIAAVFFARCFQITRTIYCPYLFTILMRHLQSVGKIYKRDMLTLELSLIVDLSPFSKCMFAKTILTATRL